MIIHLIIQIIDLLNGLKWVLRCYLVFGAGTFSTNVGVFLHLILITIWVHTHVAAKAVNPFPLLSGAELLSVLCPGPHITLTAELHARLGAWCTWPHATFVTSST